MLMMKGLLLLNVNNTVLHFCMSKRRSKRVKNLTKKEVLPKMGQKGGQKGSKIYGSC